MDKQERINELAKDMKPQIADAIDGILEAIRQ